MTETTSSGYSVLIVNVLFFVIQSITILKALLCQDVLRTTDVLYLEEVEEFHYCYFTIWTYVSILIL